MSLSFLSDTGRLDDSLAKGEGIQATLVEWGNEVIGKLKKSLKAKTSSGTSGDLEKSLVVLPIELGDSKFTLTFQAEEYWKFINSGVRGVGGKKKDGSVWANKGAGSPYSFDQFAPPVEKGKGISLWAYLKGANVWVVQQSVFHRGIKPTRFWDDVVNEKLIKDLAKRLERAGAREVEIILSKDFK